MNHYPYASRNRKEYAKLRNGQDYTEWRDPDADLQKLIVERLKPIVEIGGPTRDGFYFLDEIELPSKVVITNITDDPLPFSPDSQVIAALVDKKMDARKMLYENNSISAFLMSGMSVTSDWYLALPEVERNSDEMGRKVEKEMDIATLELEQAAIGTLQPKDAKHNQRLQIFIEVARTLEDGGLFFTDGSLGEIIVLQKMGLKLLAYTQEIIRPEDNWDGISYEFVMQQ